MAAVLALVRAELRRSSRQLFVFALVVAVGSGTVMLTVAGARRADSSYERFREVVHDGTLFVGVPGAPKRLEELRGVAEVETLAPMGYVQIYARGASDEEQDEGGGFASLDGRWLYEVQRPRVLSGQMPAPDAEDAMAVNEEFARRFGAAVGDVVPMDAASFDTDELASVDLEVAGVVRSPMDIGVNVGGPVVYLPPGVLRAHPGITALPGFGVVTLETGDAGIARFERRAAALFADEPTFRARALVDEGRTVERAIDVQVTALLAVAAVSGLVTVALVVQLTARCTRDSQASSEVLRSVGASRWQRSLAVGLPLVLATLLGVVAASSAATMLSSFLPRGLARVTEPDPGIRLDIVALAGLGLGTVACVTVVVLLLAGRATAPGRSAPSDAPAMLDRATGLAARRGNNLALLTGLRLARPARGPGERRGGITAYAGLVLGVAGLVTVAVFGHELERVADDPSEWGAPYDLVIGGLSDDGVGEGTQAVADTTGVARVARLRYTEVASLGRSEAPAFGLDPVEGPLDLTVIEGRTPAGPREVVLGVRTAAKLDLGVGDVLRLPGDGRPTRDLDVVGLGLVPIIGDNTYDDAIVLFGEGFDLLGAEEVSAALLVGLSPSADRDRVGRALTQRGADPSIVSPPGEQLNLRSTRGYPRLVGALVAVLAAAGLASALLSSASTRRLELATIRAIGFTRGQVRSSVLWQGVTLGVLGLVVGLPLGYVAARATWSAFASTLSLQETFDVPWSTLARVAVGTLAIAVVAAIPIGRRWSGRPLATDLRVG